MRGFTQVKTNLKWGMISYKENRVNWIIFMVFISLNYEYSGP